MSNARDLTFQSKSPTTLSFLDGGRAVTVGINPDGDPVNCSVNGAPLAPTVLDDQVTNFVGVLPTGPLWQVQVRRNGTTYSARAISR